jgi:hypothetical protein
LVLYRGREFTVVTELRKSDWSYIISQISYIILSKPGRPERRSKNFAKLTVLTN